MPDPTPPEVAPFAPPEAPISAALPATIPTYSVPPPMAPPTTPATPAAPARSGRRRSRLVLAIVAGAICLLVLIIGGISTLANAIVASFVMIPASGAELIPGEPGSPVAADPLDCDSACFTVDSISTMLPSEEAFVEVGMTDATFPHGTFEPGTAGEAYRGQIAAWDSSEGSPDACFFVITNSPLGPVPDQGLDGNTDVIDFLGTHENPDRTGFLDQAVRLFPDSAAASAYLADLSAAVTSCDQVTANPSTQPYAASVDPEAQLTLPSSVAGVGWARTGVPGPRWRAYVVDLQRGNAIVRTRLVTDGSVGEGEFRSWVQAYSLILASAATDAAQ